MTQYGLVAYKLGGHLKDHTNTHWCNLEALLQVHQSPSNHVLKYATAYRLTHITYTCTHTRINMWLTHMHLVYPPKPTYRVLAHADTHTCSHTWAAWSPPQNSGWHHHGTDVLVPPLQVPNYRTSIHNIMCGACVVPCYHHSRKYILMRLAVLHQPKHAVELTRVPPSHKVDPVSD